MATCSSAELSALTILRSQCSTFAPSLQTSCSCSGPSSRIFKLLSFRHFSSSPSSEEISSGLPKFRFSVFANGRRPQRHLTNSAEQPISPTGGPSFHVATSAIATSSPSSTFPEQGGPQMQSGSWDSDATSAESLDPKEDDDPVVQIHTVEQFEAAIKSADKKLVVVEYAASHSKNSASIYPVMVKLSRTISDVLFLLVMGDESDETKELCRRANVTSVPHFLFYKQGEVVHEEQGVLPDVLSEDVLYYGENHAPVLQIQDKAEVEALVEEHKDDHKLVVVDIGLKHCGPCVKVYPTVIKLAHTFAEVAIFVRVFGDENSSCKQLMRDYDVKAVPTFLFFRDGALLGRFVGSGRGELVGEMLRYQGVQCT